jgi:DNA-directed RNA polymerase specialized sigma subunit
MPRTKKDKKYYDTQQEAAVVAFLTTDNIEEKEKIYRVHLQEPINKMIESIIRTYKLQRQLYDFDDVHSDALSFLITKFHKFNPEKGYKSFSYFSRVCKNYLYNELRKEYKKNTLFSDIDDNSRGVIDRIDLSYRIDDDDIDLSNLINALIDSIKEELDKYELDSKKLNENERKIGGALIEILEDWELLFDEHHVKNSTKFNKNLILLYIRNMTGLNTKEIRNSMKRFKKLYKLMKNNYI